MADLTTLANVKGWAPIATTTVSDDALLTRLISSCSQDFLRATLRPDLLETSYSEVHMGDGATRITLWHWPIVAVATLKINGVAVPASIDKMAPGYYIDQDIDPERIYQLYLIGQTFTDGAPIAISYSAGYATVPADIEQAVIDWVVYRYKGRPNTGTVRRRSTEGEDVQVEQVDAPPTTLSVIERYRRCLPSVNRRRDEQQARMQSRVQRPQR
ncbi:MAG TPA: hypothetical protein VM554_12885 [Acidisarcina sp.]|nr:hypothetical protein [Acidisarcina sp.]